MALQFCMIMALILMLTSQSNLKMNGSPILEITITNQSIKVAVQSKNEWLSNVNFLVAAMIIGVAVQSKNEWLSNNSNFTPSGTIDCRSPI